MEEKKSWGQTTQTIPGNQSAKNGNLLSPYFTDSHMLAQ